MKKFILTIGLNDKDTKQPKYDLTTSYKIVESVLKQYTTGYTIYETHGGYKHEDGYFVQETSLRVELLFIEQQQVIDICKYIKAPTCLNQDTIALEIIDSNNMYI